MSMQSQDWSPIYVLLLPRSVIWNVVLLELLSNMVRRWHVGSAVAEDHGQFPDLIETGVKALTTSTRSHAPSIR
jgi:hypothetical protein